MPFVEPQMTDPQPASVSASAISAQQPLIFMHIPKTGGMSLFTALAEHFGTSIADLYNVSPRNAQVALRAFADPSRAVYCGHYGFGVHEWLNRPASYAAVVREPVARLVSLYHYCLPMLETYRKRLQKAGGQIEALWRDAGLSDFYLDFEATLRGDDSPAAFFRAASAEVDNGMVRRFSGWGLNPLPCPASALDAAKANVEQCFSVVGVLERYADTLQLMGRTFGLPALSENKVNANPTRPEGEAALPAQVLALIRDRNALDLALYDWLCERFDAALQAPTRLVAVPGGGRREGAGLPLWRSVGTSPLRDIALQNRGKPDLPVEVWHLLQVGRVAHSRRHVQIDMALNQPTKDGAPARLAQHRLMLAPASAQALQKALETALGSYEKHYGPVDP